jgi:N-acetylglucosaminyl-diphospho-decaprenol L-rhamnosyltransferase
MTLDVRVSVIAMANRELLGRCLASLPAACDGLRWDLAVVDNVSTDGSGDLVEREWPDATLVRNEERLGFGANHNHVLLPTAAADEARYVLVLNDDVELEPGAVRALVARADGYEALGAVGPVLVGADGTVQPSLAPFPTTRNEIASAFGRGRRSTDSGEPGWLNASCLLLRTAAVRDVGGFDERFFLFYEDADLGRRLYDRGWRSELCAAARALHHGHQTITQPEWAAAGTRHWQRSRLLYLEKHHGRARATAAGVLMRLTHALRALKALAEGAPQQARSLARLAAHDPRGPRS